MICRRTTVVQPLPNAQQGSCVKAGAVADNCEFQIRVGIVLAQPQLSFKKQILLFVLTLHQSGLDGFDSGHDLGQVGEGRVGTRQHLEGTQGGGVRVQPERQTANQRARKLNQPHCQLAKAHLSIKQRNTPGYTAMNMAACDAVGDGSQSVHRPLDHQRSMSHSR